MLVVCLGSEKYHSPLISIAVALGSLSRKVTVYPVGGLPVCVTTVVVLAADSGHRSLRHWLPAKQPTMTLAANSDYCSSRRWLPARQLAMTLGSGLTLALAVALAAGFFAPVQAVETVKSATAATAAAGTRPTLRMSRSLPAAPLTAWTPTGVEGSTLVDSVDVMVYWGTFGRHETERHDQADHRTHDLPRARPLGRVGPDDVTFQSILYTDAIAASGGAVVLIPPAAIGSASTCCRHSTGSLSVAVRMSTRRRMTQPRTQRRARFAADRDDAEFALVRAAVADGVPVLGICRGAPGAQRRARWRPDPAFA